MKQQVQIFQSDHPQGGFNITYSTSSGRKSFHLGRKLNNKNEPPPLAIESFAMDPNHYHQLMERVEKMLKKDG